MKGAMCEEPGPLPRLIGQVFRRWEADLDPVRAHSKNFARLIGKADPFIQESTAEVCPHCRQVCCINKHSYHTHFDVLYLLALGEKVPSHAVGMSDSEPCQFLSAQGCRLGRFLRPYRCTWYFCTPLLEHMRNAPVRRYRAFITCLEQISRERELLLTSFVEIAKERSLIKDVPLHEFY
jgi:hypothetical protein